MICQSKKEKTKNQGSVLMGQDKEVGGFESEWVEGFEGYEFLIFNQIESKKQLWEQVTPDNVFYSVSFLSCIEHHPPTGVFPFYGLLRKEGKLIGVLSMQIKNIDLSESMAIDDGNQKKTITQKLNIGVKNFATKMIKFNTLICGNILLTGEYGFYFLDKTILYNNQFQIVERILEKVCEVLPKYGYKIGPILMKDFYKDKQHSFNNISKTKYTEFEVEPNMMLQLKDHWNSFDDYLSDLKSKYRVRVKRAFKKLGDIEKREFSLEDIRQNNQRIYDLYKETANEAGFNLFTLPPDYFTRLKEYLGDKMKLVAYFKGDVIISYYTIIFNTDYMEAHYLGYDKSTNGAHQTYLNMLFDLIKEGIHSSNDKIQFARTALEIKSSVGAIPYEMLCYLKHRSSLKNKILPKALEWMVPIKEWKPRTPFKA